MVFDDAMRSAAEYIRELNGRLKRAKAACVALAALSVIIAAFAAGKGYGRR